MSMFESKPPHPAWKQLGWVQEAKFPTSKGARFYPCGRLDPFGKDVPLIQTPKGEARLLRVDVNTVEVLVEDAYQLYLSRKAYHQKGEPHPVLPLREVFFIHQIRYPAGPPPEWQIEVCKAEVRLMARRAA